MTRTGVAFMLLLTLLACSSEDPPPGSASPGVSATSSGADVASPTASPTPTRPGEAKAVLTRAVNEVLSRDRIAFFHEEIAAGSMVRRTVGTYVARNDAWRARTKIDTLDGKILTLLTRSVDGGVWMQMESWPEGQAGCWLAISSGQIPVGIMALRAGPPGYLDIMSTIEAEGFTGDSPTTILATVDLATTIQLLPGEVVELLDLDLGTLTTTRVPVLVELDGPRLGSVHLSGRDLLDSLAAIQHDVPVAVHLVLPSDEHTVEFPEASDDHPRAITPPAPERLITTNAPYCHLAS